jgi:hypothetical protein
MPPELKQKLASPRTPSETLGRSSVVHVAGRAEVAARHEQRREDPRAFVGNLVPGRAREQDRMAALAAVAGCEYVVSVGPPGPDDAVDRRRREVRAVGEDDDRRLGLVRERQEAAAERRARAALPVGAQHDRRARLEGVGARDDDHLVHGGGAHPRQHLLDQEPLLGRSARRGAGREHDGANHLLEIVICRMTTIWVGVPCSERRPSFPILATVVMPFVTVPSTA